MCDNLAAAGQQLNDFESTSYLLAGLGSEYDPFVTSITTRLDPLSLDDIYGNLLAHEMRIEHNLSPTEVSPPMANISTRAPMNRGRGYCGRGRTTYKGRGPSSSGRGRGNYFSQDPAAPSRPICQLCGKIGHTAPRCYQRPDPALVAPSPPAYSNAQAYYSSPSLPPEENWYPNTAATHHMTNNFQNLNLSADEYTGQDQIRIGNGTCLPILHSDSASLSLSNRPFLCRNYFMSLLYAKISFQFTNLHLQTLFSLNFTLLIFLSRIARPNVQSTKVNLTMVSINSSPRKCPHLHPKHSLVRGLHQIVGINAWVIRPFGLSTLFFPNFSFLFQQIRHLHLALPVHRPRVINCHFPVLLLLFVIP
jgi:hypothetical protein